MGFSNDSVWGVTTGSYQIEGAAFEDGKGLSIWDTYGHESGKVSEGHHGDVACDHYHRYKEDIRLMAELGVKAHRFPVSRPRVLPEGTGAMNERGIVFHSDLVDEIPKYGTTPYLTLYHWDMSYELYKRGDWLNPDMPHWLVKYAVLIAERPNDRVKNYTTFNESQVSIGSASVGGARAPRHHYTRQETLPMTHHVMLVHGLAAQTARGKVADIRVGYASTLSMPVPVTVEERDAEVARRVYFKILENGD